jgi:acetyl/propionyl-CoA carboxylase alpha subunit
LVANRGEIAVRVMRTCKRLGIRTIAVYSDADADAVHVRTADEAVRIGHPPARASYLDMDAVISAAKGAGADAVHPGYGFLSENSAFVRRCEDAGLIFVGPSAHAVELMGSKIESKRIAARVGVPTVPGYHAESQEDKTLFAEAKRIGFPVLIKASAGGGGRGMRRVDHPKNFVEALASAKAEAEAAFGDGSVLLEKFILNPRHLEVQLAGDRCGNLVHLFERDCSVQRNNQKVLEEAPAPRLTDDVRRKLYHAACSLGREISYDSAGTVEFIMEIGSDEPYFLEMNTRLQVEHPVTELITDVDLVEWQLIAAAGEALPLKQDEIQPHGHAIEARITAERADLGFRPVTGEITEVSFPRGVRIDSGVEAGSKVSLYYDSLLLKMIAHGADRPAAIERLVSGLSEMSLLGIATTQAFLRDAIRQPMFRDGEATTRFIEAAFPEGWRPEETELMALRAAACVAWAAPSAGEVNPAWVNPWLQRNAVRVTSAARSAQISLHLKDDYGEMEAEVRVRRDAVEVEAGGRRMIFAPPTADGALALMTPDDGRKFLVRRNAGAVQIARDGLALSVVVQPTIDLSLSHGRVEHTSNQILAPLHGVISKLYVAIGETVAKGAPVLQMEAMKLIHTLSAPVDGQVASLRCAAGDTVPADAVLVEILPSAADEQL